MFPFEDALKLSLADAPRDDADDDDDIDRQLQKALAMSMENDGRVVASRDTPGERVESVKPRKVPKMMMSSGVL